ncbi:alpha/beta fold hydrolase [Caproicibacterium sp. BJN0003]|uniref:alpha/beta fold hydrolase n=1 Tax=Caproicibacterium sp. BJN0003 TaxID=2994078 RepID=UPI002252DEDC|nr:alpha/beta hydrolase [Caproicibacterium sp. BJN0003]UZT81790.1 alpha/beta hydrolase [Caproicibacterium sp. BJN0003]
MDIFLLVLLIITVISFLVCLVSIAQIIIRRRKKRPSDTATARLKKSARFFSGLALLTAILVLLSQFTAHTPSIMDQQGNMLNGSIAELQKVELNGHQEWISIRGKDCHNPVLLFLAGGPGGSQMAATRNELSGLEENFVVVNWDQPGSGKSYSAVPNDKITADTYVDDGLALTDFLRQRFETEKIYLMGESWGSVLGILLASTSPEKYHAFIGTGQMVDFKETEITDYKKAMELAKANNDQKIINQLTSNGMPPYYGQDITWKSAAYLNYLSNYMTNNPEITNGGYHTLRDMFSPEYSIIDSVNYLRGIIDTFNSVYPQLYDIDLRKSHTKLDIPAYFFIGRHDVNAPIQLTQEYYDLLEAPKKGLVWFEHSGHDPWINESELFVKQTNRVFLENP